MILQEWEKKEDLKLVENDREEEIILWTS